jgi:hypothetical protein
VVRVITGRLIKRLFYDKYTTMIFGLLVLITALCISAVAIYYSVAGLVAIFAAAAVPIMIMGGVLEVSKLVTAVWLHKYWKQATWWLKSYLSVAVVVLMLITSMGIFGFLSKAHIEQTTAGEESVAQVTQIENEIARLNAVIKRADDKIKALETSGTGSDANIQSQIDKEQARIDLAFDRIKPAVEQQNNIITDARTSDTSRTKPYEDQLASITAEILRLESSAKEYETKIAGLSADSSGVEPLLAQIAGLEAEIIRVTNQLQSKERDQIRAGQAIIGVTSDGAFGGNTRRALVAWVAAQRDRITQIQGEVAQVRKDATSTVDTERTRLANVVKDIRTVQIPALKERELTMLGKIDEVRQTESPVIKTARYEIQRLRESAEAQVKNSQALIERLRGQLAQTDKAEEIDAAVDEQILKIKTAEAELDTLVEEKYALEGEYRKLEAEVGPIKYIAEFVYGESADGNMLEEAVRWVIIIIIFVFDPLAVLLLIAAQYTFEFRKKELEDDNGERLRLERQEYERARAQRIVDNPGFTPSNPAPASDANSNEDPHKPGWMFEKEEVDDTSTIDETADAIKHEPVGEVLPEEPVTEPDDTDRGLEQDQVQPDGLTETVDTDPKKKSTTSSVMEESTEKSNSPIPNTKNRMFYPEELVVPKTYVMKEDGQQVTKETKPEPSQNEPEIGYIQNEEQNNDGTLWKRMKDSE